MCPPSSDTERGEGMWVNYFWTRRRPPRPLVNAVSGMSEAAAAGWLLE
jgi:hypothetical protein